MVSPVDVEIVEVGPRDGFQPIVPFIPTATKVGLIQALHDAGLRRVEVGSFASPRAVPQLVDAAEVAVAVAGISNLDAQFLVPTEQHANRALNAGVRSLVFVVSASTAHNMSNVRRLPAESLAEFLRVASSVPIGVKLRLNIATAFDCPFDGAVPREAVWALIDAITIVGRTVELCLCDTTGRVTPDRVTELFIESRAAFPSIETWAFHGHDTYGLGLANVHAAWRAGVRVFDASFGGLGGCPFAPGATGNVATEDVVWMFERMGLRTGIDVDKLLRVATLAAALPGSAPGGRVRTALSSRGQNSLDQSVAQVEELHWDIRRTASVKVGKGG